MVHSHYQLSTENIYGNMQMRDVNIIHCKLIKSVSDISKWSKKALDGN